MNWRVFDRVLINPRAEKSRYRVKIKLRGFAVPLSIVLDASGADDQGISRRALEALPNDI